MARVMPQDSATAVAASALMELSTSPRRAPPTIPPLALPPPALTHLQAVMDRVNFGDIPKLHSDPLDPDYLNELWKRYRLALAMYNDWMSVMLAHARFDMRGYQTMRAGLAAATGMAPERLSRHMTRYDRNVAMIYDEFAKVRERYDAIINSDATAVTYRCICTMLNRRIVEVTGFLRRDLRDLNRDARIPYPWELLTPAQREGELKRSP